MAARGQTGGRLIWLLVFLAWGNYGKASEELRGCGSALRVAPAKEEAQTPRRYAPERQVDITRVTIDVTPNFMSRTIQGVTTITFTPLVKPLIELKLDAFDLNIASVESKAHIAGYTVADKAITITFSPPVLPGESAVVMIRYDAEPEQGLYFRTPELGYSAHDMHLFSQGEAIESRHWFPGFDSPNEKTTSEVDFSLGESNPGNQWRDSMASPWLKRCMSCAE